MNVLNQASGADWTLINGDSAEVLAGLPSASVGLTVTSIPFSNTYAYSPSPRDLGNVRTDAEFWAQYAFTSRELLRVMVPGRQVCVHVQNLPTFETRDGVTGRRDFRGQTIRHFQEAGFVYHSEVCIDKNPQAQAIRNKPKGLLFVQLERDASWMWQAYADYLCVFRSPGKNPEPVKTDCSHEEWIAWARPVWPDIRETDVLPVADAKEDDDEKHLCPLQLPVIERCVRLWCNRGDVVLDPHMGVGSTAVVAVRTGRKAVGVELKESYWRRSVENVRAAEAAANTPDLFAWAEAQALPQ